eukprot:1152429-Pelagomonas_calceolata.AAC.3
MVSKKEGLKWREAHGQLECSELLSPWLVHMLPLQLICHTCACGAPLACCRQHQWREGLACVSH